MIFFDSSVWIDFFNGVSTPEVVRLDALQGFRQDKDVATACQLIRSLALLHLLEGGNPWKAAENYRQLRTRGITVRKTIDGIIATACIEANLPLLFSDRDFQPYVEHLGLVEA